jgi:site-specific DNA-methyltransferase (adenine-specific)
MARKPLIGTVAANVLAHGTGGINIDATRIPLNPDEPPYVINTFDDGAKPFGGGAGHPYTSRSVIPKGREGEASAEKRYTDEGSTNFAATPGPRGGDDRGRWPANVILTDPIFDGGYDNVVGGGERSSGVMKAGTQRDSRSVDYGKMPDTATLADTYGDSGGTSRFFVIPKAARSEREPNWHGLSEFDESDQTNTVGPMAGRGQAGLRCLICGKWKVSGNPCRCPEPEWEQSKFNRPKVYNNHSTVKPLDLMCHLVRMVTPPDGIVLDPFLGSGTTAKAAELEGRRWVGIELYEHHVKIARARLMGTQRGLGL